MSYELDYEKSYICPCGKGVIVEKSFSNEWNRIKEEINLICADCKIKYHLEYIRSIHGDHEDSIPVLVPNGESVYQNTRYESFQEELCCSYPLKTLEYVSEILIDSTSCSKIKDYITREVIKKYKRYYNTMRIKAIRENVFDAIELYNKFTNNYERENDRINATKKKVVYIHNLEAAN